MRGLAVVVGEIGAGKTTLARRLLDALPEDEFEAALLVVIHRNVTSEWLLRRLAVQLGVEQPSPDKLTLLSQLYQHLTTLHEQGKKAVVLVDEAQMLGTQELMEEFRGLLNLEAPERKLLSFVFFGLPELEQNLRLDPPLAQRVSQVVRLGPLDLDTMIAYLWPEGMTGYTFVGREVSGSRAQLAQDLIFETRDGYITTGAVSDAEWQGMCRALEHPEWLDDPRFRTAQDRVVNVAERLALMADVLGQRSSAEWLERLDAESVPCAPVLERHEVFEHEQARVNEAVAEYDHPLAGRIRQPRPAARFDRTPAEIRHQAPVLGQHSREIAGSLGLDAQALIDAGVLVAPPL